MDDQRIGRVLRALRRRLGWRQIDVATRARCSQKTISRAENGHLPAVPILRRVLSTVDAALFLEVRWRAGALDRLLDEDHAALVGAVTQILTLLGWDVRLEVTYSDFGDRGSIDILAYHAMSRMLLVIEIKTDLAAVDAVLRKLDEKVRLAPKIGLERYGWRAGAVSRLLVMPESSTLRRRVERQSRVFAHALPVRGMSVRRWLADPLRPIAGLWFLSTSQQTTRIRGHGGRERVRTPKAPARSQRVAA